MDEWPIMTRNNQTLQGQHTTAVSLGLAAVLRDHGKHKLLYPARQGWVAAISLGMLACLAAGVAYAGDEPDFTSVIVMVKDAASQKGNCSERGQYGSEWK